MNNPSLTIYLSPHFDDVCFSLGMTAKMRGGGQLINIFTRSNHMANNNAPTEEITSIRDREDAHFAESCVLHRECLGLSEATVLGLAPFDLKNIEQEVSLLEKKLIPLLYGILSENRGHMAEIYCPLAIGRHRNHLSVFSVILNSWSTLREKSKIFFYEDLPYASDIDSRIEAIKRLNSYFPPTNIFRHANQMDETEMNEKLSLVALYQSQHRGPVIPGQFIPAEPSTPFPHEAYWEVL